MLFDDGSTTIEFFPDSYECRAEDFTELDENSAGAVIGAHDGGDPPRRTRTLTIRRTAAELATLRTFLEDNDGLPFEFTDDVGRVWDAEWLDDLDSAEDGNADDGDGWHLATVRLRLDGVADDTGREAYGNADVSQMSIQKAGASVLYFPLAYAPPLGRRDKSPAYKALRRGHLASDADRYGAKRNLTARFAGLPRAFISAQEDYYVDTLGGAANPFSLVHFRDGTVSFRWMGGFAFSQNGGGFYEGTIELMQEI